MADFGFFHVKSFQAPVPFISGFWASRTIMEKVLSKKNKLREFFLSKNSKKNKKKNIKGELDFNLQYQIWNPLLYQLSYPGINTCDHIFFNCIVNCVFMIFFQKSIFEITNLELYFGNHQESLKNWLGLVHLMLLYGKKPNLASQIHPTANSEFFKKNFINTKMIFVAKTAKWSLFQSFYRKNVKS